MMYTDMDIKPCLCSVFYNKQTANKAITLVSLKKCKTSQYGSL